MSNLIIGASNYLLKRALSEDDPDLTIPGDGEEGTNPVTEEIFSSWALFILLLLLISALWSSYYLQQKRIQAVHETVLSIFYGMIVGLIIRISPGHYIQDTVTFNSSYFFNVLLPPIILNSGYELHQANFFRNIGSILTFAIPGTFISACVLGTILYIWTSLGLESVNISFVDALSVGATLSATDPVTILSIFNAYKVDPKLYTIIFGESLLNDAISIVMFETCQQFHGRDAKFTSFFEGIGLFLMTFIISLLIGVIFGFLIALILKHSHIRRYPQIESCFVLLMAYQSYFFSNGCHMSGIVSLLFCGITLKHYAYYNMSRRTQISTKYIFQLLARLSENFIFVYLGLALFTEVELVYKPMLIIVTTISICIARWAAVFPLSRLVNWVHRIRSNGQSLPDEIPYQYQMMTFWAGLRGAVGVALAMGLQGEHKSTLVATVLVVVVLTVILFGGTTAGMLEVLNIKTGCVDEDVSDDEFDIEAPKLPSTNAILSNRRFNKAVPIQPYSDNMRNRSSPNIDDQQDLLKDDDVPAGIDEIPPLVANSANPIERVGSPSIVGTVQSMLHTDDRARWFQNFDEQVLKPVLLDSDTQFNNKNGGSHV
ncbi:Endosomal/prevacuolar sodium/hydrogen exchanger [Wickerhamomyces ciferrii]|uniref:Sodium/hydrogen exchanger n=1 Tax=Wickerhamomyces ciferrii (strain ATCC 14091 / BCRC 22168 / CBS 111 / JCM 3599 / NBRC 0793 / NRRL Y-1031 F-60-10) TaxID=1206466 RepID=K0KP37_WICCF|nr:Endosomal/prevacuolar sodium/hydrogen exchanger [Wickerhamomyces ciferrii]CCH43957.1 Endosomal/prevacuolar sodium/hydrogen exchanger [Wickerhamomyces ciferrii]